jgi:hypothetical protein
MLHHGMQPPSFVAVILPVPLQLHGFVSQVVTFGLPKLVDLGGRLVKVVVVAQHIVGIWRAVQVWQKTLMDWMPYWNFIISYRHRIMSILGRFIYLPWYCYGTDDGSVKDKNSQIDNNPNYFLEVRIVSDMVGHLQSPLHPMDDPYCNMGLLYFWLLDRTYLHRLDGWVLLVALSLMLVPGFYMHYKYVSMLLFHPYLLRQSNGSIIVLSYLSLYIVDFTFGHSWFGDLPCLNLRIG